VIAFAIFVKLRGCEKLLTAELAKKFRRGRREMLAEDYKPIGL
jgi:hypothetical protein